MAKTQNRIAAKFAELKKQNRKGLVWTFITAGDPDRATSQAILNDLPHWGADIIELGMAFSDPMADGPADSGSGRPRAEGGCGHEADAGDGDDLPRQGR